MRNWNQWGWLCLAVWGAATAAADVPPPKVPAQRVPASVTELGVTAKLAVDRIKSSLLPGDELGHTSFGMFCINAQPLKVSEDFAKNFGAYETSVATQLLKKYGYPLATLGTSTAFATDVAAAPDFRLGGIVKELKTETCSTGNESEGWIYLKVDWALYSEKEQKVVFQQTTEGLAVSDKKVGDLRRQAIVSTVENFIAAPEFLAAIKPGAVAPVAAAASATDDGKGVKKDAKKAAAPTGEVQPPVVAIKTPIKASEQDLKVKLAVDTVKVAMLPGDELGHSTFGAFCSGAQPLTASDAFMKNYGGFVSTVTAQTLKKNGYPLASLGKTSAFDTEQSAAPDFRVGGIVKELRMALCQTGNNAEGWIYAKIDWALYSEKAKRVVYAQTTEGLVKSNDKIPDMPTKAITASVENLLAAPEFLAALQAPQAAAAEASAASTAAVAAAPAVPADTSGRSLQLVGGKALPGGAQKNQAKLRAAVVTLETANGSGSGFYIDREGSLRTDFHGVKGAKFVKVKMANGDKLVAQVVQVSERDDVALLKSVAVDFEPLALRPDALDVGEEVYAIGTPLGVLTSTMTRGVLSADRVSQGVHELQSDAAVTFGSSGGPLLDADGRVIGLTKSGLRGEKGFNFFIPVQDALRALDVAIKK
jgi:S1-C subfamily serine protease